MLKKITWSILLIATTLLNCLPVLAMSETVGCPFSAANLTAISLSSGIFSIFLRSLQKWIISVSGKTFQTKTHTSVIFATAQQFPCPPATVPSWVSSSSRSPWSRPWWAVAAPTPVAPAAFQAQSAETSAWRQTRTRPPCDMQHKPESS